MVRAWHRRRQDARSASFLPGSLEDRVHAVAYGAIAALPASVRGRVEEQYQHGTLSDLHEAMTAWIKEAHLDQAIFAEHLLGRAADDPVALSLRSAVNAAATATSHDDIKDAAIHLADAIKGVGVDQWPRFVTAASQKARSHGSYRQHSDTSVGMQIAAAGDLQCQGFSAGCQSGGSWGATAAYSIMGRDLCVACATKMLGIENESAAEKIIMLRPFLLKGN